MSVFCSVVIESISDTGIVELSTSSRAASEMYASRTLLVIPLSGTDATKYSTSLRSTLLSDQGAV